MNYISLDNTIPSENEGNYTGKNESFYEILCILVCVYVLCTIVHKLSNYYISDIFRSGPSRNRGQRFSDRRRIICDGHIGLDLLFPRMNASLTSFDGFHSAAASEHDFARYFLTF